MKLKCLFPDLKFNSIVDAWQAKPTDQLMDEVGLNTGNLMFRHAIASQIEDVLIPCSFGNAVERASQEKFDAVIVAAANWLNSSSHNHNEYRARALRQINLPTICIGLGCQHLETTKAKLVFPKETIDLLDTLSDLNAYVLVRDNTTFSQCEHYGLKNVFLTGCPSNFMNFDEDFSEILLKNSSKEKFSKISLNAGFFAGKTLEHDLKILPLVKETGGSYVLQSNSRNIISIALRRLEEYSAKDIRYFKKAYKIKWSFKKNNPGFEDFNNLLRVYFDVPCWLSDASSWDLALGCRIHGAMAAIQTGVPAILTTVDSRTQGLAEIMKIPHLDLKKTFSWGNNVSIDAIIGEVPLDYSSYLLQRSLLMNLYSNVLLDFGLTLSKEFRKITNK